MNKALLPFLFFTFIFTTGAWGQSQSSFNPQNLHYLWPTEASPYLSSTFGETRSAHFHAALDIKTWGQRGYEVYATRDGIVDRVAIGPKGYGKVIYLKHPDESYSVYAHLLSFNNHLQQLADSVRFAEDYSFEIERFWEWRNIKVKQGDVIGYSGASGIGPPHLHFELRTPSHRPFNPLLTNLSVDDNIAPQILGISVEPLSPESSIEGENKIYTKRTWGKKGKYDAGTINISGPVGLGINVFDRSTRVHNSYAVYEISMSVDGQELFTSRVDSFSYSETNQMFIDRIYPILKERDEGFQRLYIADGNTLSFYETSPTRGMLNLEPGSHTVTIRTADYYGNTSTATLQLFVHEKEIVHSEISKRDHIPKEIAPPHKWNWFDNWVTLSENQYNQINIGADSENFIKHKDGVTVPLKNLDNLFMNIPEIGPVSLHRIKPNSVNFISSDEQHSFASFPEETVYDTISVGIAVQRNAGNSRTVKVLPEAYPLRNSYKFYLKRNYTGITNIGKWSFYKLDRDDDEWDLIPTKFSETYIIGEAKSLGTFTLKRDTTAPKLENPRITQRADEQWVMMLDAEDNLSGIDYTRSKISVNGVRGIAEFEPEDARLVYYHPDFTPTSTMTIRATVFDKMGNKRFSTFELKTGMDQAKK